MNSFELFFLGRKFATYRELENTLDRHMKETGELFNIKDCVKLVMPEDDNLSINVLKYQKVIFGCTSGGKFRTRTLGLRKTKFSCTGCEAFIYLTLTNCSRYLKVEEVNLNHNHKVTYGRTKQKEVKAEQNRRKIIQKCMISYDYAYQLERTEHYKKQSELNQNRSAELSSETSSSETDDSNDDESKSKRIYTKIGDTGFSYTFNGLKKRKDDNIFEACGTTEELNSSIGFAIEFLPKSCEEISLELRTIQIVLQDLTILIGAPKSYSIAFKEAPCVFPEVHISKIEQMINDHAQSLPESSDIVLPSGGEASSALHIARAICRRAERSCVCLVRKSEIDETALKFLNRLGDYLFTVARKVSLLTSEREHFYKDPEEEPKNAEEIFATILKT